MAQKGGPKTEQGKEISSKNSFKHGLTAKGFVNDEEKTEYESMNDGLLEEYLPVGVIELMLVNDLAMIRIKLNRFKEVEAALFIKSRNQATVTTPLAFLLDEDDEQEPDEILVNAALPPKSEFDRLYRYQTSLENQFTKKLSQLIQLQEMRAKKERITSKS